MWSYWVVVVVLLFSHLIWCEKGFEVLFPSDFSCSQFLIVSLAYQLFVYFHCWIFPLFWHHQLGTVVDLMRCWIRFLRLMKLTRTILFMVSASCKISNVSYICGVLLLLLRLPLVTGY